MYFQEIHHPSLISRLEFPYLNDIMEQGEYVHIEKAGLRIYPEYGTYSGYNTLPDSIKIRKLKAGIPSDTSK